MDKLAQPEDLMFERNVAIIASRKQQVQIFSDGFVYLGFLCGLDDEWIQMYGHEESDRDDEVTAWRFILLARENISAIGPTGENLYDVDAITREYISKKIQTFSDVCDKFLKTKGFIKDDNRRENK